MKLYDPSSYKDIISLSIPSFLLPSSFLPHCFLFLPFHLYFISASFSNSFSFFFFPLSPFSFFLHILIFFTPICLWPFLPVLPFFLRLSPSHWFWLPLMSHSLIFLLPLFLSFYLFCLYIFVSLFLPLFLFLSFFFCFIYFYFISVSFSFWYRQKTLNFWFFFFLLRHKYVNSIEVSKI